MLLQKNISGVYSDEIFKEQNKIVEDKIRDIQVAKSDEMIARYNLEGITKFIKDKLQYPAKTYSESDLQQKRVLLCSIFPSGLVWSYEGYSNTLISPFYKAITDFNFCSNSIGRAARSRRIRGYSATAV